MSKTKEDPKGSRSYLLLDGTMPRLYKGSLPTNSKKLGGK